MYKIDGIGVHIKVRQFEKSVEFYNALGFKKVFEYGPNKEVKEDYNGVVFDSGSGKLEIAQGHRAIKTSVFKESVKSSKISLMINVSDVSLVIGKAKKAGIKLAVNPRHYYWGSLEVVIKDPDGVILVFISPYSEELAKKIKADENFAIKP